jgi:DNA-binding MarR family transcriptional regulator
VTRVIEEKARQRVQPRPAATDCTALLIRTVQQIQCLGFTLLEAARRYRRRFEKRSRELALDYAQCRTLITLAENKGVTQQRLAELTVTDPAALGRSLDRLEARGWAKRRRRPGDRRARSLAISSKARAHLPLLRKMLRESELTAVNGLSREEVQLLVRALNRVVANLKMHLPGVAAAMPLEAATRLQETTA